ncbi:MAG TPA: hypothetical protein VFH50_11920 [Acidimicrobiales bacterium]|nr:hypothetical protein [Acidimicrobiales bacterium]
MAEPAAYYARRGPWADWWTLLHPPYTAWHLSFVVIGACLAPHVVVSTLVGTLVAFFLAVGLAAHALDELHGRPLGTSIPSPVLAAVAGASLAGALILGAVGVVRVGGWLVLFMAVGVGLVVGYDLELGGGAVHGGAGFALGWGAFPVLTAAFAQTHSVTGGAVLAAGGAAAWSGAQRALSTPARTLRRRVRGAQVRLVHADGTVDQVGRRELLAPLEQALRLSSWAAVLLAVGLAVSRLG